LVSGHIKASGANFPVFRNEKQKVYMILGSVDFENYRRIGGKKHM
jgi:hypothetical protein